MAMQKVIGAETLWGLERVLMAVTMLVLLVGNFIEAMKLNQESNSQNAEKQKITDFVEYFKEEWASQKSNDEVLKLIQDRYQTTPEVVAHAAHIHSVITTMPDYHVDLHYQVAYLSGLLNEIDAIISETSSAEQQRRLDAACVWLCVDLDMRQHINLIPGTRDYQVWELCQGIVMESMHCIKDSRPNGLSEKIKQLFVRKIKQNNGRNLMFERIKTLFEHRLNQLDLAPVIEAVHKIWNTPPSSINEYSYNTFRNNIKKVVTQLCAANKKNPPTSISLVAMLELTLFLKTAFFNYSLCYRPDQFTTFYEKTSEWVRAALEYHELPLYTSPNNQQGNHPTTTTAMCEMPPPPYPPTH